MARLIFNSVVGEKGAGAPLDLEIPDRQLVVFAGPRGSGKSTALRMMAGLEKISSGEITLGEKRIDALAPHERDVAMVFADDSLYPHMTMRENMAFGLKRRRFGKSEIKKRVDDAANALRIGDHLDKLPNDFDMAIRQRAAIARAIARQPQILLYDHALTHVEPESRAELRDEIVKLHERLRATTIFVTADNREAMSMAETIVLFEEGAAVKAIGNPRMLYEQPGNMVIARSLGDPPMNFVHGDLKLERGAVHFHETGDGTIRLNLSSFQGFEVERPFVGKSVVLGVRPEHIEVASESAKQRNPAAIFRAIAERVEPFGAETEIHFTTGAHAGVCRSAGHLDRSAAGRRIEFVINLEKVCFFEQSDGKRII